MARVKGPLYPTNKTDMESVSYSLQVWLRTSFADANYGNQRVDWCTDVWLT
jgi:hypothetical protein